MVRVLLAMGLVTGVVSTTQQIPPLTVLRIAAGPAGTEAQGAFVLSEERDVFSRASDREIVVVVHWEDVPGRHALGVTWRSPDGGTTSASTIDYIAAEKRFGSVWRLPVTPGMALGRWTMDATVDGRPAGRYSFEITDATVKAADVRRPLTEAQAHERLSKAFVVLQRGTRAGATLGPVAGFLPSPQDGRLFTVMPRVDGADTLVAIAADGSRHSVDRVTAHDRRQQWAVLQVPLPGAGEPLARANYDEVAVGTRCFAMEGTADGVRVLIGGTVSGQMTTGGRRVLIVSFANAFGMPGAPVIDEYGRLLGMLGAGLPGDQRPLEHVTDARGQLQGAPLLRLPDETRLSPTTATSLDELRASGLLMPSANTRHVVNAGFAMGTLKNTSSRIDYESEFRRNGNPFTLVVEWSASERLRGQAVVTLFDIDGKAVGTSKPRKVDLKVRQFVTTMWPLTSELPAGMYRADVTIDGATCWRGFFRIIE